MRSNFGKLLLGLGLLAVAAPALADRGPSKEEASAIAATLTAEGFKHWGKVELDDHVWKVEGAHGIDGKSYDLKLNQAFQIIKKERD